LPSRERIIEIYKAYAEGRFELLMEEVIHDDITFVSHAPPQLFPFFKHGRGKDDLLAAWRESRIHFKFIAYEPIFIVADETGAAVIVLMKIRHEATNRSLALIVADFLKFRDGRVIDFHQFMDSLDAMEQFLGRKIADSITLEPQGLPSLQYSS
jgi:ketosteroid isomerase-like protein